MEYTKDIFCWFLTLVLLFFTHTFAIHLTMLTGTIDAVATGSSTAMFHDSAASFTFRI